MRRRRVQLGWAIFDQAAACVPELMLDGDAERRRQVHAAIMTVMDWCLEAIERGLPPTGGLVVPPIVLEQARVTAREGLSIGPLLRAVQAGYQPFVALLVSEAEKLPNSVLVRAHLREAYGGLLGELTAVIDREYDYERQRAVRLSALDGGGGELPDTDALSTLTRTERRVLELLLVRGVLADKQIAEELDMSWQTVHVHMRHIFRKLDVHSRRELVHRLSHVGWTAGIESTR